MLEKHQAYAPISALPIPESLETFIANNFNDLKDRRVLLDEALLELASLLTDEELLQPISLMHVFDHQTA
ncbi:MAG: hypothetical protein GY951_14145 [Psychromonas sp.]|nr:hypothetical protein [Alteromonadales bacterium]MCP5079182.1 hypothetical protein [Psychromonas sp.]